MLKRLVSIKAQNLTQGIKDLSKGLAEFQEQWNSYVVPFLNSLPKGLSEDRWPLEREIDPIRFPVDGSQILVDNLASATRDSGAFWHSRLNRPQTIQEALIGLSSTGTSRISYSLIDLYHNGELLGEAHTLDFTRGIGLAARVSNSLRIDISPNFKGEDSGRQVMTGANTLELGSGVEVEMSGTVAVLSVPTAVGEGAVDLGDCLCFTDEEIVTESAGPADQGKPVRLGLTSRFSQTVVPFPVAPTCSPNSMVTLDANGEMPLCALPADDASTGDRSFVLSRGDTRLDPSFFPEQEVSLDVPCGENNDVVSNAGSALFTVGGLGGRVITFPEPTDDGSYLIYDSDGCAWTWQPKNSACFDPDANTIGLWDFQNNRNDTSGNGHHAAAGGVVSGEILFKDSDYTWMVLHNDRVRTFTNDIDFHITGDITLEAWFKYGSAGQTGEVSLIGVINNTDWDSPTVNGETLYSLNVEYSNNYTRDTWSLGVNGGWSITNDGTYLWVSCESGNSVVKIHPDTGVVAQTITGFSSPRDIIYVNSHIYVVDSGNDQVVKIHPTTYSTTNIVVGDNPWGLATNGTYLWCSNTVGDSVSKINLSTDVVDATIGGVDDPRFMVFAFSYLWVAEAATGRVAQINPSTDTVDATVTTHADCQGITSDGTSLWCVGSARISSVDPIGLVELTDDALPFTSSPQNIFWDGDYLWLLNIGNGAYGGAYRLNSSLPGSLGFPALKTGDSSAVAAKGATLLGGYIWFCDASQNIMKLEKATSFQTERMTAIRGQPYLYHRDLNGTEYRLTSQVVVPENDWAYLVATRQVNGTLSGMTEDVDCVGLWRLNETTGTVVDDELDTHDGVSSGVTLSTEGVYTGDRSYLFTGTSAYVDTFANSSDFHLLGAMTLECWIYLNSIPAAGEYYHIVSSQNTVLAVEGDNWPFGLQVVQAGANANFRYVHHSGAMSPKTLDTTLLATRCWMHVAVTRTAGGLTTFYIDGQASTNSTLTMPTGGGNTSLRFGAGRRHIDMALRPFEGYISEVRISDVARDASAILASYNAGKGTLTQKIYLNGLEVATESGIRRPNGGGLSTLEFAHQSTFGNQINFGCVHISRGVLSAARILEAYERGIGL